MTEEKVVEIKKRKSKPKMVEIRAREEFVSCVGDPKTVKTLEEAITKLCKKKDLTSVEFVRKFRAFRLYRDKNHLDWISLDDINQYFNLGLNSFKGQERNYQKPLHRIY